MFTVPTIFTAIDKMTAPMRKMAESGVTFGKKLEVGISKGDKLFSKLTPVLSETSKQLLSFAQTAAIAGAIVGGITFSVGAIKDYENAVASFRTIVSDLSYKDFAKFQDKINEVARDSKKSSIDVAQAFEKIAGLNASFAKSPEAIGAVTKAVITLSKASGDDLGASAQSLIGIMNQYGFAADQADRTINVLAAGAGVGAASITQAAESFTMFGSVAKGANVTLEQSVGLIQTLGYASTFGSEAGTQLKGTIIQLQKAGLGYKSGQFQINDALEEAKKKFDKLKSAKEKDAFITKTFGLINIATGRTLLNNLDLYKKYTEDVTNTSAAADQAAIRSNTLSNKIDELKAAWVNMLTGSDSATSGLKQVKKAIGFVTDNLETIVKWGVRVLGFFVAWKAILIASKAAMIAYNVVMGITNALMGASAFTVSENTIAYAAYRATVVTTTGATTAFASAQTALNAAIVANPIGATIVLLGALVLAIAAVIDKYEEWEKVEKRRYQQNQAKKNEAFSIQDARLKHLNQGKTLKEAESMARKEAAQNVLTGIKQQRALLDSPVESVRNAAQEKLNSMYGQAQSVTNKNVFSESGPRYSNTKELGSYVAPIKSDQQMSIPTPDWTNMPKQQVELTINAPENTVADVKGDTKFVKIKTTSTMTVPGQ
jgi:TP901 family phage tail tape measure protein